jgi:hypothetical protein
MTEGKGFRLATSVGGVLTGRGGDFIIIDDPLKPDEAVSETQRNAVNDWYQHTLYSRLNNKDKGCIIIIMQRLHEDDLVGHVLQRGQWKVLSFPAIAVEDETYVIKTPYGARNVRRRAGEALHPERESLEVLQTIHNTQGEYNFAGQYQQQPTPLGGGMVKTAWFRLTKSARSRRNSIWFFRAGIRLSKPTSSATIVCARRGGRTRTTSTCCTSYVGGWNIRN